jgi:hypothetical protein
MVDDSETDWRGEKRREEEKGVEMEMRFGRLLRTLENVFVSVASVVRGSWIFVLFLERASVTSVQPSDWSTGSPSQTMSLP